MTGPPVFRGAARSPRLLEGIRWLAVAGLLFLLFGLLFGPRQLEAGSVPLKILWLVWWPLLVLSPLLVGRLWCAVCPAGFLAERGALLGSPRRRLRVPRGAGGLFPWILLVLVGGFDTGWAVAPFARNTLFLLVLFLLAALAADAAGGGRLWCSVLCPLGGFLKTLAAASPVALTPDPERCAAVCGPEGCAVEGICPAGIAPRALRIEDPCPQCLRCVPACPGDALDYRLTATFEGVVAEKGGIPPWGPLLVLGFALAKNLYVTIPWGELQARLAEASGLTEVAVRLASYPLLVGAPALLYRLLAKGGEREGGPLVPLAVFALLANLTFHLLVKGGELKPEPTLVPLASAPTVNAAMVAVAALGVLLSAGVTLFSGRPAGRAASASIPLWGGALLFLALAPKNLLLQCLC